MARYYVLYSLLENSMKNEKLENSLGKFDVEGPFVSQKPLN